MKPKSRPANWSARAIRPAHCGDPELVPPTTYQPMLHGLAPPQPVPSALDPMLSAMYTSTPVRELAWYPMSGTPRMFEFGPGAPTDEPMYELPGGSVS